MSDDDEVIYRPSLGKALKNGFLSAYDHLAYVVFASLACSAVVVAVYGLSVLAATEMHGIARLALILIPALAAGFVCAAGVFYYAYASAFDKHSTVMDTLKGMKMLAWPAVQLFVMDAIVTVMLAAGSVFFIGRMAAGFGYLAGALLGAYLLAMWLILAMYHLPLLAAQSDMESGPKPLIILRKSFLLTIDNLSFTLGLFVVIIAIVVLCALPVFIGIIAVFLGVIAFVLSHAIKELFKKYGIVQPEAEPIEDHQWRLPDSWRKRGQGEDVPQE